ncbi:hypothetical protein [Rugamonas rubra]|uniref:Uncharacterized protein n=1 Tax=Rugamonas rubra TaxID=758825 RepID=A0A1I4SIW3_9BURK|nr:hypothetical protein [Rugamonas rubra]SFM64354.1 hypothetical protein SAMN02982985_04802 [Rugamonas rubra]
MNTVTQLRAAQVKRLAGLANVVGALLGAIDTMRPDAQADALRACAGMTADIADDLDELVGGAS